MPGMNEADGSAMLHRAEDNAIEHVPLSHLPAASFSCVPAGAQRRREGGDGGRWGKQSVPGGPAAAPPASPHPPTSPPPTERRCSSRCKTTAALEMGCGASDDLWLISRWLAHAPPPGEDESHEGEEDGGGGRDWREGIGDTEAAEIGYEIGRV